MNEKTLKDLLSSLKTAGKPKTSAYDTTATVTRIEGGTAWVHIPGGVAETPVKLTISAKAGDNVQVRVSGGRAFMVGNASAPPTDDTVATGAVRQISTVRKVVEKVREVAETASRIAGNTNQYFWHTQEGTDTGAHITEIPQEEFLADPEHGGGNLLARSNGIAMRDGLDELASFSSDGIGIGTDDNTKVKLNATDGLKLGNSVQIRPNGTAKFTGDVYASGGQLGNFILGEGFTGEWYDEDAGKTYVVSVGYSEPVLLGDYAKCFYIQEVGNNSPNFYVTPDGYVGSKYFNALAVKSYTPTWESGQAPANSHCVVSAGLCSLFYQGSGGAHSNQTLLGTLPVGARPKSLVFCPCVKGANAYGMVQIDTDGKIYLGYISSASVTARLYFNCSFPVV